MKKSSLFKQPELVQPIEREEPRIGRNDPCLCGSGLKYKKCCLILVNLTKQLERHMEFQDDELDLGLQ